MIATVLGGIGLFLLGMILLSDGLKRLAGDALRTWLQRFTGSRLSALATGAVLTALVQSSTAVTVATVGFVNAGLLTLVQAIGVIFGSNLGSTMTSWIVSIFGLKMSIGVFAMPVIGAGALTYLVGRGRLKWLGWAVTGFGLVFVGIETLQSGMRDADHILRPELFPSASLLGRLALVFVGTLMTIIMQSSGAASATTLTALSTGAINLTQGACLAIGQNIGTTLTAMLSAVGGSTAAKRAGLAHVMFNVLTGVLAFLILPIFLSAVEHFTDDYVSPNDAVALSAFHTAFNLLGVLVLLPFLRAFTGLIERIIPEHGPAASLRLDPRVAALPSVAIDSASRATLDIARALFHATSVELTTPPNRPDRELPDVAGALGEIRAYVGSIVTQSSAGTVHERHIALLRAVDHLDELLDRMLNDVDYQNLRLFPRLVPLKRSLNLLVQAARDDASPDRVIALSARLDGKLEPLRAEIREERESILHATARGAFRTDEALPLFDAIRALDRFAEDMIKAVRYLARVQALHDAVADAQQPPAEVTTVAPD